MIDSFTFDSFRRHLVTSLVGGVAAAALIACSGGADGEKSVTKTGDTSQYTLPNDRGVGSTTAPIVLVEYASVICPACANWATTVYPDLKKKYIDTGKVRYVFRPFPTNPRQLADAGHMIALCTGDDKFMTNIKYQFERQSQIMAMAQQGKAREAYLNIAKNSGLSDADFEACLVNEDIQKEYDDYIQSGVDIGISGTPSFIVNGEYTKKSPSGKQFFTLESMEEVFLPLLGEEAPKADATEEKSE
jgi:protein-disulfide isomerase